SRTGTSITHFLWVGQVGYYADVENSALYMRQRSYNASIGRWQSRDPLYYVLNQRAYIYANNNAISMFDPSGLLCEVCRWRRIVDESKFNDHDDLLTHGQPHGFGILALVNVDHENRFQLKARHVDNPILFNYGLRDRRNSAGFMFGQVTVGKGKYWVPTRPFA